MKLRDCSFALTVGVVFFTAGTAATAQTCFNGDNMPMCNQFDLPNCPGDTLNAFVVLDPPEDLVGVNDVTVTATRVDNDQEVSFLSCNFLFCGVYALCVSPGDYFLEAQHESANLTFFFQGAQLPTMITIPDALENGQSTNIVAVLDGGGCTDDSDCPDDGNFCTEAVCADGGLCQQQPANEGNMCNDNNMSTCGDVCTSGVCVGEPCGGGGCNPPCVDNDNDPCTTVACINDVCVPMDAIDGTACNDGSACNGSDTCQNGVCVNTGADVDCSHLDSECAVGDCTEPSGTCFLDPLPNGSECDDQNSCTITECQNGNCVVVSGDESYLVGGIAVPGCDPVNPLAGDIIAGLPVSIDCDNTSGSTETDCDTGIFGFNVPCGNCELSIDHPEAACNGAYDIFVDGNNEGSSANLVIGDANDAINQNITIVANIVLTDLGGNGLVDLNDDLPPLAACLFDGLPLPDEFVCECPPPGCLCRGDCNLDGLLTIAGDVPCTINNFFAASSGDACPPIESDDCLGAVQASATRTAGILTGGMIISDVSRPFSSGVANELVKVRKQGTQEQFGAYTDALGLWRVELPEDGTYTFETESGEPQTFEVNASTRSDIESIVWVVDQNRRSRDREIGRRR